MRRIFIVFFLFIFSIPLFCQEKGKAYSISNDFEIDGSSQKSYKNILSDNTRFAEYVYKNMHYPLIDLVNNVEGTAVYKYWSVKRQIEIVRSSGSLSLDGEGERLLRRIIALQDDDHGPREISIDFNLADNKIYSLSDSLEETPEFPYISNAVKIIVIMIQ